ncbi:hypothetical protein [Legionella parisiensis]|uniref:Lipoprotein n=1 Tax=Legionella parisiensis TaxID=45071 RepID=A0A1E5JW10_9GAMM|nr:hypothetical protein [Legionella parisiensis]KTD43145.1 hypothetical protein Lpar_1122 [Legionella parisiensis]OEH48258.1 hypothetical protein lpari_00750 [Legionella parisiensis]STX77776.1 Uncharacterised protein [Legionella parisiensis]
MRFFIYTVFLLLCGCGIGPRQLTHDRLDYNRSLQYSDSQQYLLNVVRLRYDEHPSLLTVNNIIAQIALESSASLNVLKAEAGPLTGTANGQLAYTETPTITYTPLQGEAYVKRLLTPLSLPVVYSLFRSGWDIRHVLMLTAQRIGPLDNAVIASSSISNHVPRYREFFELVNALDFLQYQHNVEINPTKIHGQFAIKFTLTHLELLKPSWRKLINRMGITPSSPSIWLVGVHDTHPDHFYLETRTILGFLNYLAKSVEVPAELIKSGKAPMTYLGNGKFFNWQNVTRDNIIIRSCKHKPDADLSIKFKGYWYYIADNDFKSKETFALLNIIMSLQQGNIPLDKPVFSIN